MSFCGIILFILIIWLNIQALLTQSPPSFEWQYPLWTKHNELRSQIATGSVHNQPFATNMEQILYESNLEQIPLQHASQCSYTHNDDLDTDVKAIADELSFKFSSFDQFGENIAYFEFINGSFLSANQLQDSIEEQWFNYNDYDYATHECTSSSNTTHCNSYQRLLWAKTRYMACGVSICPSLLFPNSDTISNAVFIVCNYWPSYDTDELPIYTTTASDDDDMVQDYMCSDCPTDRSTECTDGLCVGCPAPNYYYCQDRISICDASADLCDKDPVIQLYCLYTCFCTEDDWVPDTECNALYLDAPIHDACHRLGWFDVQQIESNNSIKCEDGYTLPTMDNIAFVEENCLTSHDRELLDDVIMKAGTDYRPNGIAIDWVQYDIGCEWNENYNDGVIPAHNGIKCGDREQLFICVQDTITTALPTVDEVSTTILISTQDISETLSELPTITSVYPTDQPTEEPTHEDDTDAPTNSPTEGPTFSPTVEPTSVPSLEPTTIPIFDTTMDVDVSATTEPYEPFRMYLVFPDELQNVANDGNIRDSRRLSANDIVTDVEIEAVSDSKKHINLYPLHGVSVSSPLDNDAVYGYQFSLSKTVANKMEVGLSQILYTLDSNLCGLRLHEFNDSLIHFQLFKNKMGKWIETESVGYSVKAKDNRENKWTDIVIDISDHHLEFDVLYMFVIDVSLLWDNYRNLSHVIYAKSFGDFEIELDRFSVKHVKGIAYSDNNANAYRYWMKMSIKFT